MHIHPQLFHERDGRILSVVPPEGRIPPVPCKECGGTHWLYSSSPDGSVCIVHCLACGAEGGSAPKAKNAGKRRCNKKKSEWAQIVADRYGGRCAVCGSTDRLEAHHVIPVYADDDMRFCLNNGILLCKKHHDEAHAAFFRKTTLQEK